MRKRYKGDWTVKVEGMWYDKKNGHFTSNPNFERGDYSSHYHTHFKKLASRKINHILQTKDKALIHVLYRTSKKGKRKLKEWELSK